MMPQYSCDGTCNTERLIHKFSDRESFLLHVEKDHIHILDRHKRVCEHGYSYESAPTPSQNETVDEPRIIYNLEQIARKFHEEYERISCKLKYDTNESTIKPWELVSGRDKILMMATVVSVFNDLDLEIR